MIEEKISIAGLAGVGSFSNLYSYFLNDGCVSVTFNQVEEKKKETVINQRWRLTCGVCTTNYFLSENVECGGGIQKMPAVVLWLHST